MKQPNPNFTVNDFTTDLQKDLFDYWNSIRGDRAMPSRQDFNPVDIPHVLPILVMSEVHYDPLRFKIRLWGTENVKFSGKDLTGLWFHEQDYASEVEKRYCWIIENRKPYLVLADMDWSIRDYNKYTALVLPFSSDGEKIDIILSGNHYF
jgi:hypothetical protein